MFFDKCPYAGCGQEFGLKVPEGILPLLEQHRCEGCGRLIFMLHSKILPQTFTEAEFKKMYRFNRETMHVSLIPQSRNHYEHTR